MSGSHGAAAGNPIDELRDRLSRYVAADLQARPITDRETVQWVVEKFREKYGASDVKKYDSKFDVAVVADLETAATAARR
ncbi:MAG TPA: hypothetical protein VFA60_10815 [Terriglobales bacterium]|nr:hypothetical protein [Terriglobales bacterium]